MSRLLQITPEEYFLDRRLFLKAAGLAMAFPGPAWAAQFGLPAKRNPTYDLKDPDRKLTEGKLHQEYNNFYEFTTDKEKVHEKVKDWNIANWPVEISGLVKKPMTIEVEDLVKMMSLEERVYRFRCVERWAMVVPWTGFVLADLLKKVQPLEKAKYVRFTSFMDKKVMPGIAQQPFYPWPYMEGLRLDEAMHPLTLMATGAYGKPLPKQNGAPIRLVVPWKYGFKSIKSIVKIELVEQQPKTLWNESAPKEYGFYANVNPQVPHPRWSQSKDIMVNGGFLPPQVATLMFNGYEKEVAGLYKGMDLKANF